MTLQGHVSVCGQLSPSPSLLSMDIRSLAEQDMALISFYKQPNVEWGRPLNCKLEGCSNINFQLSKKIFQVFPLNVFCQTIPCVTGDTAVGQGVTRLFFSTCMEKLRSGFCINFGMYVRCMASSLMLFIV